MSKLISFEYFPSLQNSDEFFEKIIDGVNKSARIINQLFMLILFAFIYGAFMGAYSSVLQAVSAGLKVAVLFLLVLVICFPAFYIVQYILGSRLQFHQIISIILSGFVLTTAIMISFVPIVLIFLLTGSNYYFLQLLHIGIFIFSGIFGMNTVVQALKFACDKKSIYPQTGVSVFQFWIVILAFVGIQLAWNFRPFLGDRGEEFKLFRDYEGNFYTALIYSFNQLVSDEKEEPKYNYRYYENETNEDTTALHEYFEDTTGGK